MEIVTGVFVAVLGLVLVLVIKLSTTLFHELGHAIPALLFTNKKVEVYIGSYGDLSNSFHLSLGRLKIYLKWNIFNWRLGMCRQEESTDAVWKEVLILLGGPMASLLISIPLLLNLDSFQSNSILFFIIVFFITAAFFDFLVNMIPSSSPLKMHDGKLVYCDGYVLYTIFKRHTASKEFFKLENLFLAKEYTEVVALGEEILTVQGDKRYVYDFIINSLMMNGNYNEALKYYNVLGAKDKLKDDDYFKIGKLYKASGDFSQALKFYRHYWYKNYQDIDLLNEISDVQIELGYNEEAIKTLNVLMNIDGNNLRSYLLRSKAFINIESYELSEADLNTAKAINLSDPTIYYQLGVLYEKLERYSDSLQSFVKSKALNGNQDDIDSKIEYLKER